MAKKKEIPKSSYVEELLSEIYEDVEFDPPSSTDNINSMTNYSDEERFTEILDGGKIIKVKFEKIFDQDLEHTDEFSLVKKRTYVNIAQLIADSMEYLLQNSYDFAVGLLQAKINIMSIEIEYEEEDLMFDIFNLILTPSVVKLISDYVEDTYTISLDEDTRKSKVANEELQFTDEHGKIILKSSMTMKVIIPLITEFLKVVDVSKNENLFIEIYNRIFMLYETPNVNINNKLNKLIESRVAATQYSDNVIWRLLKNLGMNKTVAVRLFYRKIIVSVAPKILNNTNIVSYLHSVIKNLIKYQFTENFQISYKPLNLNVADSEGLTDFDKLEVNMIRSDEGFLILNRLGIKAVILTIMSDLKMNISEEEFEHYKKYMVINKAQTNIVGLFISRYTKSYNINMADYEEYIMLCILTEKWLSLNNFPILSQYVVAIPPDKYSEKKSINKKQFMSKLLNSRKYNNLLEGKYAFVIQNMIDSGIITKMIATLKSNKFYKLPEFGIEIKEDEEYEVLDEKIESISDEFLSFLERV